MTGHIPHGMCGLKSGSDSAGNVPVLSHPSRDVWIEIWFYLDFLHGGGCHIPHGMCGLKFIINCQPPDFFGSHPSRDVWIEIMRIIFSKE